MNKWIPIFVLFAVFLLPINIFAQSDSSIVLKTSRFAGIYSNGKNIEKERVGSVIIYPESDSTVLFYLDLNRGAPSYNMGNLFGRLQLLGNEGVFHQTSDYSDGACILEFYFSGNKLTIRTQDISCGFGFGVIADGEYKRRKNEIIHSFYDPTGGERFFENADPSEMYNE